MSGLRTIAAEAETLAPVFIVGEARSGTSLLLRILQTLPSLRPATLNLAESRVLDHPCRAQHFLPELPDGMRAYMANDAAAMSAFQDAIAPIARLHRLLAWPPHARLARLTLAWWLLTRNHRVIQAFFHFAKGARRCERIIEKTPSNAAHLSKLRAAFPRCRMLYIHRHPLDVFSSYRRRHEKEGTRWTDIDAREFARLYERGSSAAMRFATHHPEQLLLISYDRFTHEPQEEIARICAFIGEDPNAVRLAGDEAPSWASDADPHLFGDITPKTKEWSRWVTPQDARALQARLAPLMDRLGHAARAVE